MTPRYIPYLEPVGQKPGYTYLRWGGGGGGGGRWDPDIHIMILAWGGGGEGGPGHAHNDT